MKRYLGILLLASALCAGSCKMFVEVLHDDDVVAEAGTHKLYARELSAYIPDGLSVEDSTKIAHQYIDSWALDMLFLDVAESELSKTEKDVSVELEDYRRSLLKYRYEQKYVNQRLDTTISNAQIEAYYKDHQENFILSSTIVKARFLNISKDSPSLPSIRRRMSSQDPAEAQGLDSLAFSSALRYTSYDGRWVDALVLSREFGGEGYESLLSSRRDGFIERTDSYGNLSIAYVSDVLKEGSPGPLDYYRDRIRDIILSNRKQALLVGLERDLLDKARNQETFKVY